MFVEYLPRQIPDKPFRRAVYKRTYIIVYKVTDTDLDVLTIPHTTQNPDGILLENNYNPNFSNRRYRACRDRPSSRATSVMLPR